MIQRYNILNLKPYINWAYFYHAWSVKESTDEAVSLKTDAERLLHEMSGNAEALGVFELFDCWSVGDDIQLLQPQSCPCPSCRENPHVVAVLPMLRQQYPDSDGFCWCLSDFVKPKDMVCGKDLLLPHTPIYDKIGVFTTSVRLSSLQVDESDSYARMLLQTVSDRLAEAAAERLHEQVRRTFWGYAPDEDLMPEELFREQYQGIRPAVGYPCLPDLSLNFVIDDILDLSCIGVTLTEHGMMQPHASVSGLMIAHPKAHYFAVGTVSEDQRLDYSGRRGMDTDKYLK